MLLSKNPRVSIFYNPNLDKNRDICYTLLINKVRTVIMKANSMCISCLLAQQEKKFRNFPDEERKAQYMQKLLKLLYERGREDSAPLLYEELMELFKEEWGYADTDAAVTEVERQRARLIKQQK